MTAAHNIAGTKTAKRRRPSADGGELVVAWMEDLSRDRCTAQEFLSAMFDHFREKIDGHWEVLSLLDQYYRRAKIKPGIYRIVKSRVDDWILHGEADSPSVTAPTTSAAASTPAAPKNTVSSFANVPHKAAPTAPGGVRRVAVGDVLRSRYRVIGVLGRGGMSTVYAAADKYRLDLLPAGQHIAVKVLHTMVTEREELLCELQREFQHLQSLSHPNIIRVHEFDRDGDTAFFTMELLNGVLLSRLINARRSAALPRAHSLSIIRDTGAALAYAHSRGVVHGDVNPQNIFITNEGELRVLDFGAAHSMRRTGWSANDDSSFAIPVATPGYASCQVLEGQRPDARDDTFSFACVIYLLLSGKHPFPGLSAVEARNKKIRTPRPVGLEGSQWRVLREGLNWDRARRPSDVQNWLERLKLLGAAPHLPPLPHLLTSPTPRSSKALLSAAAVLLLALLAAGGYWVAAIHHPLSDASHVTSTAPVVPAVTPPLVAVPAELPSPTSMPAAVPGSSQPPVARAIEVPAPPDADTSTSAQVAVAGKVRIELVADTVDVAPTERTAHIVVHRKGSLREAASFNWWTESGTAKPGVDFVPAMPHTTAIEKGSSSVTLDVAVSDRPRHQPKSFYVVIDKVESGPALGARTLTMVTILPPD